MAWHTHLPQTSQMVSDSSWSPWLPKGSRRWNKNGEKLKHRCYCFAIRNGLSQVRIHCYRAIHGYPRACFPMSWFWTVMNHDEVETDHTWEYLPLAGHGTWNIQIDVGIETRWEVRWCQTCYARCMPDEISRLVSDEVSQCMSDIAAEISLYTLHLFSSWVI